MIYLDYAANTPVEKDVLKEYVNATTKYIANPNSSHPLGIEAKKIIDDSSNVIASYFDINKENIIMINTIIVLTNLLGLLSSSVIISSFFSFDINSPIKLILLSYIP